MPTWNIPKAPQQPVEPDPLEDWSAFETPAGAVHLVGCVYTIGGREGRVSSAVQRLDPATATAHTKSGRIYTLRGRPGGNLDSDYVWAKFRDREGITDTVDVTQRFWSQIVEAGGLDERGRRRKDAARLYPLSDEHGSLVLAEAATTGLRDAQAGGVVSVEELDKALRQTPPAT